MEPEIITDDSLSGDAHMTPSDADSAVSTKPADAGEVKTQSADALSLAELNSYLGKNFQNKDTALKALKDTYSYVGKKKEDIAKEITNNNQTADEIRAVREEVAKLRKENFYSKNPDLNTPEYRDIIERLGGNPEEVINMPTFKAIYEKAKGFDESQKLRTVLESNPRTVATKDRLSKARTAVQQGNYAQAKELAIDAVVSQMLK